MYNLISKQATVTLLLTMIINFSTQFMHGSMQVLNQELEEHDANRAADKNLTEILERWSRAYCEQRGVRLKWIDISAKRRKVKKNKQIIAWQKESSLNPYLSHDISIEYHGQPRKDVSKSTLVTGIETWVDNSHATESQRPVIKDSIRVQKEYKLTLQEGLKLGAKLKASFSPPFGTLEAEVYGECDFTTRRELNKSFGEMLEFEIPITTTPRTATHVCVLIQKEFLNRDFLLRDRMSGYFVIAYTKKLSSRTHFFIVPIAFPFSQHVHDGFTLDNDCVIAEVQGIASGNTFAQMYVDYKYYAYETLENIPLIGRNAYIIEHDIRANEQEHGAAIPQVVKAIQSQAGIHEDTPWADLLPEIIYFEQESSESDEEEISVEIVG